MLNLEICGLQIFVTATQLQPLAQTSGQVWYCRSAWTGYPQSVCTDGSNCLHTVSFICIGFFFCRENEYSAACFKSTRLILQKRFLMNSKSSAAICVRHHCQFSSFPQLQIKVKMVLWHVTEAHWGDMSHKRVMIVPVYS